jgi:hypothetical protein
MIDMYIKEMTARSKLFYGAGGEKQNNDKIYIHYIFLCNHLDRLKRDKKNIKDKKRYRKTSKIIKRSIRHFEQVIGIKKLNLIDKLFLIIKWRQYRR